MVKTDFQRKKRSQTGENKEMKTKGKLPLNIKQIFVYVGKFLASQLNYIIPADNQKYITMSKKLMGHFNSTEQLLTAYVQGGARLSMNTKNRYANKCCLSRCLFRKPYVHHFNHANTPNILELLFGTIFSQ